jgi:hypothetical protein
MSDGLITHDIAGRLFTEATRMTYQRHLYVLRLTVEARLESGQPLINAVDAARSPALLAGFLVPVEDGRAVKWTPETAAATAEYLAEVEDPAAFDLLNEMLLGLLAGFFGGSGALPDNSPTSLPGPSVAAPPTSEALAPIGGAAI